MIILLLSSTTILCSVASLMSFLRACVSVRERPWVFEAFVFQLKHPSFSFCLWEGRGEAEAKCVSEALKLNFLWWQFQYHLIHCLCVSGSSWRTAWHSWELEPVTPSCGRWVRMSEVKVTGSSPSTVGGRRTVSVKGTSNALLLQN